MIVIISSCSDLRGPHDTFRKTQTPRWNFTPPTFDCPNRKCHKANACGRCGRMQVVRGRQCRDGCCFVKSLGCMRAPTYVSHNVPSGTLVALSTVRASASPSRLGRPRRVWSGTTDKASANFEALAACPSSQCRRCARGSSPSSNARAYK